MTRLKTVIATTRHNPQRRNVTSALSMPISDHLFSGRKMTDVDAPLNPNKQTNKQTSVDSTGFPGCQPVSMDRENLQYLADMPYKVSWKADGTR